MALTPFALSLLAPHLRGARVLCFGYPDLLVTRTEAQAILGCGPLTRINESGAHHKRTEEMAETREAFSAAGAASCMFLDVTPSRGQEVQRDLNYSVNVGVWDLVIDAGTIEHCANIGQALMNAANAVARNGRVFHSPPLNMVNHGFYNISPTLLVDFYEQNGWAVEHLSEFDKKPPYSAHYAHPSGRYFPTTERALYFMARRPEDTSIALKWPTQRKYL